MNETIFIKKIKTSNFTTVDNGFVRDTRLSWKAKGIFLYLLSLPDDWKLSVKELQKHATDGKTALQSGIKELVTFGYMKLTTIKDDKGRFSGTKFEIDEYGNLPITLQKYDFPETENPQPENPPAENQPLLNTNILNTNNTKNLNKQNTESTNFTESSPISNISNTLSSPTEKKNKKYTKQQYLECMNIYTNNRHELAKENQTITDEVYPFPVFMKLLKKCFEYYGYEKTKEAIEKSVLNTWAVQNAKYSLTAILSPKMIPKYLVNENDNTSSHFSKSLRRETFNAENEYVYGGVL